MESPITLTIHGAQFIATLTVLGLLLNQHKVWVRVKDRINVLWHKHCKETGDVFTTLDGNGR